jgi:hypothetical protein
LAQGVFFSQPSVVRGLVLLPFWALGKTLIALFSLLFTALSPVLQILLGVLLNAALLFGLFALLLKLLFPNLRWGSVYEAKPSCCSRLARSAFGCGHGSSPILGGLSPDQHRDQVGFALKFSPCSAGGSSASEAKPPLSRYKKEAFASK